jgi:hypothetical protein
MEKMLLNLIIRRAQSETVMRWIAMGIAAIPKQHRLAKCGEVRELIAGIIAEQGWNGAEADACVRRNMESISQLVSDFDRKCVVPCPVQADAA